MSDDNGVQADICNPRAFGDRVLVKQDAALEKIGLIIVPQGSEQYPAFGTVLGIGPKCKYPDFAVGDRVAFKRRPASAIVWDSRINCICPDEWRGLVMLRHEDILAVIDGVVTESSDA